MFDRSSIGNIIIFMGNLLLAGALFLWLILKKRKAGPAKKRADIPGEAFRCLLEAGIYISSVVGMADLIMQGIEVPGGGSGALSIVKVIFIEGLTGVFLLIRMILLRTETCTQRDHETAACTQSDHEAAACTPRDHETAACTQRDHKAAACTPRNHEAVNWAEWEYTAALLPLMALAGRRQEPGGLAAFGKQLFILLLLALLLYLGHRRRREKPGEDMADDDSLHRQRQADYLENVDIQYQRTRELWHDLKNHINVLEILAGEEKLSELRDYLGSFKRDVESRMLPMKTGCTPVDALLGDKLYLARRREIDISLQVCDLSEIHIQPTDLCVVLGNLLDNAVEACDRLEGKKRILLRMKRQEEFYYLTVVNTALPPVRDGEGIVSRKKGRDNGVGHGLGLRSVERIAHQYGGSLVTGYEEGEFRAIVRMEG